MLELVLLVVGVSLVVFAVTFVGAFLFLSIMHGIDREV